MMKVAQSAKEEEAKKEDRRIQNLSNDLNSKINSQDLRINKINSRMTELNKKIEDQVSSLCPVFQGRDEDEEKRKEDSRNAILTELKTKIDRIGKDFVELASQSSETNGQIDGKISNKADLELIKDLESKLFIS